MEQSVELARPAWSANALFRWESRALAAAVMAASFVFPLNGLGVDLCPLHAASGLPCPGCGLSRGIASITQGDFARAWRMNPFSFLAWAAFVALVLVSVLPASRRRQFIARASASDTLARFYKWSVLSFAAFGAARFLVFLVVGWKFP